jgi:hypothetical protein
MFLGEGIPFRGVVAVRLQTKVFLSAPHAGLPRQFDNALSHTPPGGNVDVRAGLE